MTHQNILAMLSLIAMGETVAYHSDEVVAAARKAVDAATEQLGRDSWTDPLGNTVKTLRGPGVFHQVSAVKASGRVHIQTFRLDHYGRPIRRVERLDLPRDVTPDNIRHLPLSETLVADLTGLAEDVAGARLLDPNLYNKAAVLVFSRPPAKPRYGDPFRAAGRRITDAARRVGRKVTLAA